MIEVYRRQLSRCLILRSLFVILLYSFFVQPAPLLADGPVVVQEFRYHAPEAGEVFLVWGFNNWAVAPEETRPAGTFVEYQVMHTPMTLEGDTFVTKVQTPVGAMVDYGFQIRKLRNGSELGEWVWDGDYRVRPSADGVIEAAAKLAPGTNPAAATITGNRLPLLLGLSLVFAAGAIVMVRRQAISVRFKTFFGGARLIYLRDLLRELVVRDMRLRYKRSILGLAWSLLNPLAQLLVLYLIFSQVLQLNVPNYPVFLFTGLLVWTWFQSSLFSAASVILENPDLIRQPGFPVAVLPIVTVTTNLIHFLLALPILLVFLFLSGTHLSPAILILPLIVLLQFLFTLSLSYLVAAIHVTFRDTQYLLGILLLLGFYLSPIFYEASLIPERFQFIYRLNPMVDVITAYRAILIHGQPPDYLPLFVLGGITVVFLWAGYKTFVRISYRFIEEI